MNVSRKYSDGSVASRHVCRDVNGRFKPCNPDFNYQDRYSIGSRFLCHLEYATIEEVAKARKELKHRLLLDLPVRTDTKGGSGGSKGVESDPFRMVRCDICGRPIQACRCDPGRDY